MAQWQLEPGKDPLIFDGLSANVLPANVDAERTILGAVLLDNMAFYEAGEAGIEPEDFLVDTHRRIWQRMSDLMNAAQAVDIVTLAHELARNKEIETVGGVTYLATLTEGLPRRPVIGAYLRIVKDKALAWRLMLIGSTAVARAAEGSDTAAKIAGEVGDQILEASARVSRQAAPVAEVLPDAAMKFEQEADSPAGTILGAHLLTAEIDRVTSGLMGEELCLLAGRPGCGKTEGALQIALANARRGLRVHFQSLEMRNQQLLRRLWRLMARIPVSKMRDPRTLTPSERHAIRMAQEELAGLPIEIDDTHELTTSEFRSRAVLAAKRWKADLLIVDYAQLLLVPKARNIIEAAPRQAEALRHIARDYCRTLALAQIRRAPPSDLNRYPDIEDILGSSAFEQASQLILLLHRTRKDKEYTGEDFCFLGKMRELQDLRSFGIKAERWGEFRDRFAQPDYGKPHWSDN
jgi:replicative DNA helicase